MSARFRIRDRLLSGTGGSTVPRMCLAGLLVFVSTLVPPLLPTVKAQVPAPQSSESEALTLPLAVDLALRSNPLTRATIAGRDLAKARTDEARAARYPQLQLSETFNNGNNPVFVFGSLLEQGRFTAQNFSLPQLNNPDPLTNFRFGVSLRVPLFDQWQTSTKIRQAQNGERQAEAASTEIEQQVRFTTLKAFYGLLLAGERKLVAGESVRLAEADVKLSRDRVDAGTAVYSDLLAAQVQLAEARQQMIEADGEIFTAEAALNTALGLPIDSKRRIDGNLSSRVLEVEAQDELIRLGLENRPDIIQSRWATDSADVQVRGARNEYLPRVDFFANTGASRHNWINGSGDYIIGASITFNLFDAGRGARIAQARASASLASSEQQHLRNQATLEVVSSFQHYVSARERLKVAEQMITQATEALRIVRDRYQEGLTTITEVLRAENTLTRIRLGLLTNRYEYYVGYARLRLATGRLYDVAAFVA
jgi:outer membrane protein